MPKTRLSARGMVRPIVQALDQDLQQKERSRSLDFGRVLDFRSWHRISASLTRALPPIATLKVKIHEQDRATPRSLTYAFVHLRPQGLQHRIIVLPRPRGQECKGALIQFMHGVQGVLTLPTLRLDRRARLRLLFYARFLSLEKWERNLPIERPRRLGCRVSAGSFQ